MKINFFNPEHLDKNLKVTIHKTGKMGFTMDASKKLRLNINNSANIGSNSEDSTDDNLYLFIYSDDQGAFKISKAGNYFYINTKLIFDNLKIDYVKENVIYDMSEMEDGSTKFYKLKRRENKKKEKENEI